ncbi:hypothetical protein OIDMADRAFT_199344 [Oidiodendron maius Zn]|uniref:Uncharacterized protein n=1 Tax=Oidiodendron maius (strain Zn) TaxID=913774 RepID=A0A0C3HCX7_OIDMZ|nr:hypothetical protein OIDMADRAFT_199344 [Oidiodendron maius Zn]
MSPPPGNFFTKQRTPLLLTAFVGGGALFIAMKWRAVIQRSEAAKRAGARHDYGVATGRSGGGI